MRSGKFLNTFLYISISLTAFMNYLKLTYIFIIMDALLTELRKRKVAYEKFLVFLISSLCISSVGQRAE